MTKYHQIKNLPTIYHSKEIFLKFVFMELRSEHFYKPQTEREWGEVIKLISERKPELIYHSAISSSYSDWPILGLESGKIDLWSQIATHHTTELTKEEFLEKLDIKPHNHRIDLKFKFI